MRDTQGLRTRIALLACVPGLLACSPPPKPRAADQDEGKEQRNAKGDRKGDRKVGEARKRYYDEKAKREGKSRAEVTPRAQLAAERAEARKQLANKKGVNPSTANPNAVPGQGPNTLPGGVPGDPPWIDGYNPEEEHCISGNWCGALDAVEVVKVVGVPVEMDCAARIAGGKASESIKADPKTYAGLSTAPNMQGSLNQHGTELLRAKSGNDKMCCYHWFEYCSGRPHLGDDGPVLAELSPGDAWVEEDDSPVLGPAALRERIAGAWLEDARAEHASVAAFARATLELMALGAPPDLLVQAQQAGLDEIDHTRRCLQVARRYGADAMQPGPLPALAPRAAQLTQLAADTFVEGCVGETIAALVAQRATRHCADADVKAHLRQIADDEARHAALAWETLEWARREGGVAVDRRLREVADHLRSERPTTAPPAESDAVLLAQHGRLDARAMSLAADDAWREVIGPMLDSLLAVPRTAPVPPRPA